MRYSLGFIYLLFGALKFFPNLSPAEWIAGETVVRMSGGLLSPQISLWLLATLECAIGLGLIANVCMTYVFVLFMFHMAGTFTPFVLLPQATISFARFAPTLEGQYILKNVVLVAGGWSVFQPHVMPLLQRFRPHLWRTAVPVVQPPIAGESFTMAQYATGHRTDADF